MGSLKHEFLSTEDLVRANTILDSININAHGKENGATLLMSTVNCGNSDKVKLLLSRGADITAINTYGETALTYAVSMGNYEIITILLDNGADPNHKNKFGRSVLKSAKENEKIRALLLTKGADPNAPDTEVKQDFIC